MPEPLPFFTRLWFAWVTAFRVVFDGLFAGKVYALKNGADLAPDSLDGAPLTSRGAGPRSGSRSGSAARGESQKPKTVDTVPPKPPSPEPALQLLALLQREGRFVDFLQQDLVGYADDQVGAIARVVHEGCRKALTAHLHVVPVRKEPEGANVLIEEDFSASEIKLTGNVEGSAPYRGVLRHRGWRAESIKLPVALAGHDVTVLAPAEVEL